MGGCQREPQPPPFPVQGLHPSVPLSACKRDKEEGAEQGVPKE